MIKYFIAQLHLWLGLISGVIVLIISITGCIYVFSKEITDARRKDAIYVQKTGEQTIPLSQLWEKTQKELGSESEVSWVNIYNNPDKSWVFYSYKGNKNATTYFGMVEHYISVYVNPYTATVQGKYDEKYDFFNLVKFIHWSLLLSTKIGQPIVGWSTFVFVILLITGLVLWWPKSFRSAKNLFRFKWNKNTSVYRKFYDLHNVLGFYILLIAMVIALTGMVWAFKWFQMIVYVVASGTVTPPDLSQEKSIPTSYEQVSPIDKVFEFTRQRYADAAGFRLSPASDSMGVINVNVQQKEGLYYMMHTLQFDQYSGELLKEHTFDDQNAGEKVIRANYDIHVGSILGIPGKIIAFLASLICASLPVTGFLIWWEKRKKKKKPIFQQNRP